MDVVGGNLVAELRCNGVGLRDFLGFEPLALEHIEEVGVAADIELAGALHPDATVLEEIGKDAVDDGRSDLRLDVVSNDRKTGLFEAPPPVVLTGDENRDAVHKGATRLQHLLHVPLRRLLATDRQVTDDDIRLGLLEDVDDIGRRAGCLGDDLGQVLAEPVVGHASLDGYALERDIGELVGVVLSGEDRFGEILPDFLGVDVECAAEFDIADVVAAQIDVHQAGYLLIVRGILVVLNALNESRGAIPNADNSYANFSQE